MQNPVRSTAYLGPVRDADAGYLEAPQALIDTFLVVDIQMSRPLV
jgi:hypothetical protein